MKQAILSSLTALLAFSASAHGRTFSIPQKSAAPGNSVIFPVSFDAAVGCASIQIQLNYDSQILNYVGFETGNGLGSQFSPTSFVENGVVTLIWTRSTGLASGSGILGNVTFRVNEGAEIGVVTPVTISNFETSDETGVVEYALAESISAISGALMVSTGPADSDNDGIPDSWETTHSLNPESSNFNVDSDHDGRTDFLEYAFGGNPRSPDSEKSPKSGSVVDSGGTYLSLSFDRQKNTSLVYRVMESSTLGSWTEVMLPARLVGSPVDHGDGTEKVTVRSSFRMQGVGAPGSGFMKVEVKKP